MHNAYISDMDTGHIGVALCNLTRRSLEMEKKACHKTYGKSDTYDLHNWNVVILQNRLQKDQEQVAWLTKPWFDAKGQGIGPAWLPHHTDK